MHLPLLSTYYSNFTGASRSASRKRNTTQETSDDDAAGNARPPRKTVGKKKTLVEKPPSKKQSGKQVSSRKKGKEVRMNYKTGLGSAEYMLLRRQDCYTTPRDNEVADHRFWCKEQSYIYTDIYLDYRHPIRVMNPVKLSLLKDKQAFALAASVVERFQLDDLIEICCPYNHGRSVMEMKVGHDPPFPNCKN